MKSEATDSDSPAGTSFEAQCRSFQRLVAWQGQIIEITNDLLGDRSDGIDAAINTALFRAGQLIGADWVYVLRLRDADRVDNTHEWVADGIEPLLDQLQALPYDLLVDWRDEFTAGRQVFIPDVAPLPETSVVRDPLPEQGVKSLLAASMLRDGKLRGFVGFNSVRDYRRFRPLESHLIQILVNSINAVMERAEAEAAGNAIRERLRAKSELLHATLNAVPDLLLELDGKGCLVATYAGATLRLPRKVLLGRLPEEVTRGNQALLMRDIMAEVDRDGYSSCHEFEVDRPLKSSRFQVSACAKSQEQNKGYVVQIRDITQRHRQDMERARLRDEFEMAQHRQLIAQCASGIAHDLNNLIAVVDGTANILEAYAGDDDKILVETKRIRNAMHTARRLVANLGSPDPSEARRAVHDLRPLITQGADLVGSWRRADQIVTVTIPDHQCLVWGNATEILQVIINLATNACDAKAKRPNRVGISVLSRPEAVPARTPDLGDYRPDMGYSVFAISDTGTGVSPMQRAHIFDRYFTTKGDHGTGLGMPIVASIVHNNDALLWFDTTPGEGSQVTVAWPSSAPAGAAMAVGR